MPIDIKNDSLETALKKLKAREETFAHLETILNFGSWEVDLITHKSKWSEQSYKIYGLDEKTTEPTLELFLEHVLPKDIEKIHAGIKQSIETGLVTSTACQIRREDGKILDIFLNGQVIFDDNKKPIKLIGTTQDISEQVALKKHSDELANLLEFSLNEIYIVDYHSLQYLYVNQGASKALQYSLDEFLEMTIYDVNPFLDKESVTLLKQELEIKKFILNRTQHRRKDGTTYDVQSYIHKINYHGIDAYVIFDNDISHIIQTEKLLKIQSEQLHHQAHHDTLTNLPNRTLFQDRMAQTIISAKRNSSNFALLFIDLDQFKKINDSLGHHIGDEVLIEVSHRLKESIREEDTLSRLGGDEFTIIIKNVKSPQDVAHIAEKIINSMKLPLKIKSHTLFISSSIGISLYPQDAKAQHDLLKFADTAMYKAKDEGRDNFQFYSSDMTAMAFERVVMENSLRVAIKEEQFIVYFQPQYNAITNRVEGMEALVRWQHPQIGLVPPGKFIPIAEESGLIIEIDRLVMKRAMSQFAEWYAMGLNPGVLALNLAMKQLAEDDFIDKLLETMDELNFKAQWLALEVTEGQIMNNPDASIEKLKEISKMGIELAIDDFGTGYSSLAYLKKLPLDKLKIDQSFVRDITTDEDDAAIIKAIIALGSSLNMKLIAEGVETVEQKEFLVQNGCPNIQGYLFARPMPSDEVVSLISAKD